MGSYEIIWGGLGYKWGLILYRNILYVFKFYVLIKNKIC